MYVNGVSIELFLHVNLPCFCFQVLFSHQNASKTMKHSLLCHIQGQTAERTQAGVFSNQHASYGEVNYFFSTSAAWLNMPVYESQNALWARVDT
ncbi:unnamed protein product [Urochloa humidicola]